MTQCAKIIVGFMANVGNVFYPTFTNVFFKFSPRFLTFSDVFLFQSQRLLHVWYSTLSLSVCLYLVMSRPSSVLFRPVAVAEHTVLADGTRLVYTQAGWKAELTWMDGVA